MEEFQEFTDNELEHAIRNLRIYGATTENPPSRATVLQHLRKMVPNHDAAWERFLDHCVFLGWGYWWTGGEHSRVGNLWTKDGGGKSLNLSPSITSTASRTRTAIAAHTSASGGNARSRSRSPRSWETHEELQWSGNDSSDDDAASEHLVPIKSEELPDRDPLYPTNPGVPTTSVQDYPQTPTSPSHSMRRAWQILGNWDQEKSRRSEAPSSDEYDGKSEAIDGESPLHSISSQRGLGEFKSLDDGLVLPRLLRDTPSSKEERLQALAITRLPPLWKVLQHRDPPPSGSIGPIQSHRLQERDRVGPYSRQADDRPRNGSAPVREEEERRYCAQQLPLSSANVPFFSTHSDAAQSWQQALGPISALPQYHRPAYGYPHYVPNQPHSQYAPISRAAPFRQPYPLPLFVPNPAGASNSSNDVHYPVGYTNFQELQSMGHSSFVPLPRRHLQKHNSLV